MGKETKIQWTESSAIDAKVPVFLKQLGTHLATENGYKDRHGGDIEEWPVSARIRQMPTAYGR